MTLELSEDWGWRTVTEQGLKDWLMLERREDDGCVLEMLVGGPQPWLLAVNVYDRKALARTRKLSYRMPASQAVVSADGSLIPRFGNIKDVRRRAGRWLEAGITLARLRTL